MSARILTAATISIVFAGVLPARAADQQLVRLMMPDAQVLAGVNVEQAKATPFGKYVLSQIKPDDPNLLQLTQLTGFDPTRDVREVLVGSNGTAAEKNGLILARGTFDGARIATVATEHGGVTETYNGVTIVEDPQKANGFAFPDNTLAIAGPIANVKAALDRMKTSQSLATTVLNQVNKWSNAQDAWAITTVPLNTLHPSPNAPPIPGLNGQGSFAAIQSGAAGVKFGSLVVVSAEVQADTAQNATTLGDTLKLLANLVQMQAANQPAAVALAQSLQVSTAGPVLSVSISLPEDQLQQVIQQGKNGAVGAKPNAHRPQHSVRKQ